MANEWVKVDLFGDNNDGQQVPFTVATGASVSVGQLMRLVTPFTATVNTGTRASGPQAYSGVCAQEKIVNSIARLSNWTQGDFIARASGAISTGEPITGAEDNDVTASRTYVVQASGAPTIIGYAKEDIADGSTGMIRLDL